MRQESVAEPGALARAPHEPGDVRAPEVRRVLALGLPHADEVVVPRIGHGAARVGRLDRAERVVLRRDRLLREQVEEATLADVGQADDAHLQVGLDTAEACGERRASVLLLLLGRHPELTTTTRSRLAEGVSERSAHNHV